MVDANLGSSEIRSRDFGVPARQANVLWCRGVEKCLSKQKTVRLEDAMFYPVFALTQNLYHLLINTIRCSDGICKQERCRIGKTSHFHCKFMSHQSAGDNEIHGCMF